MSGVETIYPPTNNYITDSGRKYCASPKIYKNPPKIHKGAVSVTSSVNSCEFVTKSSTDSTVSSSSSTSSTVTSSCDMVSISKGTDSTCSFVTEPAKMPVINIPDPMMRETPKEPLTIKLINPVTAKDCKTVLLVDQTIGDDTNPN